MQRFKINPFYGRFDIADEDIGPAGDVEFLEGDVGGSVPPNAGKVVFVKGGIGCDVTGVPGTNTLTINTTGGGLEWEDVIATPKAMLSHYGYMANTAGLLTFTLPAVSAFGDVIEVIGWGAGGWRINQAALQSIRYGNQSSVVGIGGFVASTNRYDTIQITCLVANTTWAVTKSVGVLDIT